VGASSNSHRLFIYWKTNYYIKKLKYNKNIKPFLVPRFTFFHLLLIISTLHQRHSTKAILNISMRNRVPMRGGVTCKSRQCSCSRRARRVWRRRTRRGPRRRLMRARCGTRAGSGTRTSRARSRTAPDHGNATGPARTRRCHGTGATCYRAQICIQENQSDQPILTNGYIINSNYSALTAVCVSCLCV
jgi:hypothetical protein